MNVNIFEKYNVMKIHDEEKQVRVINEFKSWIYNVLQQEKKFRI